MAVRRSSRRSGGYRSSGVRRGSGSRSRSRGAVSSRRRVGTARRSSSSGRTIRLVIEQAAPTAQPVIGQSGAYAVPDTSVPKRAKF